MIANRGTVRIDDTASVSPSPTGYALAGTQVQITAPDETADHPLVLVFTLDASQIAGQSAANLVVFRNGSLVLACTGPSGTAQPDPCVSRGRRWVMVT